MASQPANTTIAVHRRIRAQRDDPLHVSVKQRSAAVGLNDLIMVVPGEEIQIYEFRDSTFRTDAFRYGHPVTVVARTKTTFEAAAETIVGLNFPITFPCYPRDKFLEESAATVGGDLHGDLRAIAAAPRGLFTEV